MAKKLSKQLAIKNQLEKINKVLEEIQMKKQFDQEKYNVKKLQPKATDIELNKCTHLYFDKDSGECLMCGYNLDFNVHDLEELQKSANYLVKNLETFKTILYSCGSIKEIVAAKKYFDMIPLLKNIDALHSIGIDMLINSSQDPIEDELSEQNEEYFIKALALEDESEDDVKEEVTPNE